MGTNQKHEYNHQETIPGGESPPLPPTTDTSVVNTSDTEKAAPINIAHVDSHIHDNDRVTLKTWIIVVVLASSYAISFWPVAFYATIQSQVAVRLGAEPSQGTWMTSIYTLGSCIAFMICGANSDLFGRRTFILVGNVAIIVGSIVGGTSHSIGQTIAASAILGFGGGNCQIASFALPELLPNRWKHIGVVIADLGITFDVVIGPVASRIALDSGAWRWGYWGMTFAQGISFIILVFCVYFPPKHPRGIPWSQALRDLDYVGAFLFITASSLVISGINYVQFLSANSPKVIGLLVGGFVTLTLFALWESFNTNLKLPLTPPRLFAANKGRRYAAPFLCGFVIVMFFYATNISWGTMVSVYFDGPTVPKWKIYLLSTVQGWGLLAGSILLAALGNRLEHWVWQMVVSFALTTLFGGLMACVTPQTLNLGIAFAFLCSTCYGYAQYLAITYVQFGADQTELGIAGGLGGAARSGGAAVAATIFSTVLLTSQANWAQTHVIAAAEAAGASTETATALLAAFPLGAEAVAKVPGLTPEVALAGGAAFLQSFVEGIKNLSYASVGFGGLATICCFFLEDIGPKMNRRIEIFLENDVQAEKNVYH